LEFYETRIYLKLSLPIVNHTATLYLQPDLKNAFEVKFKSYNAQVANLPAGRQDW
jgi:hypothetical protein